MSTPALFTLLSRCRQEAYDHARWSPVLRNLDEIEVGITHIDRADRTNSTCAVDRAFDDRNIAILQLTNNNIKRAGCDEAKIQSTWYWRMRLGLKLMPLHMDIDLLLAEHKRLATLPERLQAHPQSVNVEGHARIEVDRGEDQMVEAINHDDISLGE